MSTQDHICGPWRAEGWENVVVNDAGGNTVVCCPGGTTLAEVQARARLIAAGPEMLEALEECLAAELARRAKLLSGAPATTYTERRIDRIRRAIAKARGRTALAEIDGMERAP